MGTLYAKLGIASICAVLGAACAQRAEVSRDEAELGAAPWFVPWINGQPWVDQRSNFGPNPRPRSFLVGHANPLAVSDRQFAILSDMAANQRDGRAKVVNALTQCFSGGFADDHHVLSGNPAPPLGPRIISTVSSTTHNMVSYYPNKPANKPLDFAWAYIGSITLGKQKSAELAMSASQLNMFQNPAAVFPDPAALISPPAGTEQSVYFWNLQFAAVNTDLDGPGSRGAGKKIAVLWSGQPKRVDSKQLAVLISLLNRNFGFLLEDIYLFWHNGRIPPGHILQQFVRPAMGRGINVAATDAYNPNGLSPIQRVYMSKFNRPVDEPARSAFCSPELLFTFVNDHGAHDPAFPGGRPRSGPGPGQDPDMEDDYGSSGSSPQPYDPNYKTQLDADGATIPLEDFPVALDIAMGGTEDYCSNPQTPYSTIPEGELVDVIEELEEDLPPSVVVPPYTPPPYSGGELPSECEAACPRDYLDPAGYEACLDACLAGYADPTGWVCHVHDTPGATPPEIEACVCAVDPFCCEVQWDSICVGEVESLGCGSCGGVVVVKVE